LNIDFGTVLRWDNFPLAIFGQRGKARWLICLGMTGSFTQIAAIYCSTTTTQIHDFSHSGRRRNHSHFVFRVSQFPLFDEVCAIDFDEKPYPIDQTTFSIHSADIETKGCLPDETMRMIYNRFLKSSAISPIEMNDIHDSYNKVGITGLKRKKRIKKRTS
jgi:hypothetical protein